MEKFETKYHKIQVRSTSFTARILKQMFIEIFFILRLVFHKVMTINQTFNSKLNNVLFINEFDNNKYFPIFSIPYFK
jgi:hypothetical protein